MGPIDILWELASSKLQDTAAWVPFAISAAIGLGAFQLQKRVKLWQYKLGIIVAAVGLVLAVCNCFLTWNFNYLYAFAGGLVALPILYFLAMQTWNRVCLTRVKKLYQKHLYVEALALLGRLRVRWLTTKKLRAYQKTRFLLLVNLGSIRKARTYLDEICGEERAYYHFALHILAYRSGDLKTSFAEIQAAEDSEDLKNDPLLQFQVIMNHGVCYAAEKNYHLADEYYKKAIAFCDSHQLQDEELLGTFYYDYAFNHLRLAPDGEEWKADLDACESRLDMKKTDAQVRMLNMWLELLRQTEAPRETIDHLLKNAFHSITGGKLPIRNQVLFASSAARVAWAAQVDPIPCLRLLSDHISVIDSLPANQRYQVYTDLDVLFHDLHGPANDSFDVLRDRVSCYLKNEAVNDLRHWQSELPEEAIYARCDCLKKLAIQYKNRKPDDWAHIIEFQQNLIRLCHDNELYLEELQARQDVIDELLDERNRDEDFRPKRLDEAREQLASAEELLSRLEGHPALAESYIRLGAYCIELNEYEKSICYLRLFRGTTISVQNFAPGLRRYYAILLFHVRVILFDRAIKEAAADERRLLLDERIQDWFATYPHHNGELESMLLGRFLSASLVKMKVWFPPGAEEPGVHTWLWIPELDLNIDLTYPQFERDDQCRSIFFYHDRHPFEAGTSLTLQLSGRDCPLSFENFICPQLGRNQDDVRRDLTDTIYKFVCDQVPEDCPTMDEFSQLMREFTEPIPIPTGPT